MIKKTLPTEHQEQSAFVQWFRIQFPTIRILAIPNGLRTSMRQAVKAKREGLSAGAPDLFIPAWCLWIEFKRSKGGKLSQEQKDWHEYLEEHCDQMVLVANGCTDGVSKVMELYRLFDTINN